MKIGSTVFACLASVTGLIGHVDDAMVMAVLSAAFALLYIGEGLE